MKRTLFLLMLVQVISLPVNGQAGILDKFIGRWEAKGKSFNLPSETSMTWETALSGKFIRLTYRIVMHPAQGNDQVFEGEALYKISGGNSLTATWFDSQGAVHPISATSTETTLTSLWGTSATSQGKTIYTLKEDGTMELEDYILTKNGEWRQFNHGVFNRK